VKFLVDVCVSHRVVEYLRESGHDVCLARDSDPMADDEEILRNASSMGRVLITNDKDFGRFIFLHSHPHVGLVRIPNARGAELVDIMRQVLAGHSEDLLSGAIVTATLKRIRVRKTVQ
jgi:predicted nuclease of predicted toxin-antitoxin system